MHKEVEGELIRAGLVTAGELEAAKEKSRNNRESILLNLLEGLPAETCRAITKVLAQHYKIPMLSMKKIVPPPDIMALCSSKQARKLHFLPVALLENRIVVGMVDPLDLHLSDEIRAIFQRIVQPVFISLDDFEHNYYRIFRKGATLPEENPELLNTSRLKKTFLGENETGLPEEEREIISRKFAARIISKVLTSNASSFSIEPQQDVCLVNITLDGTEHNLYRFSISHHRAMVDAMMRMAKLDPSHDEGVDRFSRCQVKYKERNYILAYSFRHSPTGDKVVVHIIDPQLESLSIDQFGLSSKELAKLETALASGGIIVVAGPTGSGKSTLLRSMTRHAVGKGKATFTVEDIVGLKIDGARQFQIKPDGPGKSQILTALRSKGAEVVVVDEVDKESFSAAVECAGSGMLILLSVTAPDINEALSRIMRTGISRSELAPHLKIVCGHKIVRRLCPKCKTTKPVHPTTVSQWQLPDNIQFQTADGCDACQGSGFQGTLNLTEFFEVSPAIAEMIRQGASGPELVRQARYEGMLTLIEKAITKAIDGTTSLEEVLASVNFDRPFPVRSRMRMGRIMPLKQESEKAEESGHGPAAVESPARDKSDAVVIDFPKSSETIEAPAEVVEEEVAPPPPPASEASPEQNEKNNILLLDDSPVSLEFTKHILNVSGHFNVDTADNAAKALEMLQNKQYHLLITDQEMPDQTGLEFIESIRRHPSLNSVGAILLTGNLNEMSALGSGADGFIGKPTDPEILIARAKSISDIYKRLSASEQQSSQPSPAPASLQQPSSASASPGKVEFTEQDMDSISSFELDVPVTDATANPAVLVAGNPEDDEDMSEFDNLFK